MSLADDLRISLQTLEDYTDSPTFQWRGDTYPCTVSTESRGTTYESGGKISEIQMTLIVRSDALPIQIKELGDSAIGTADQDTGTADSAKAPPKSGRIVYFKNRRYRIVGMVRNDPQAGFYRMDLTSADR